MSTNGNVMNEWKLREQMCEIGRRIYAKGFAAANDGNISYRLSEDRVLCTPTRVSKGFMKPDDLCIIDLEGKQISGKRKRSSEMLLHLTYMKARPDIRSVVHCHPPHATAFAVAKEPIPKCVLPEIEVFLGEVAISPYETPGGQKFADTILPYAKDTDTILLANHGTITSGIDLEDAYFKTEIIDAYCRILLLAKQLGRVNYYSDEKAAELLRLKPGLGIPDPRLGLGLENCDLCGNSLFREGYGDFSPEPRVFIHPKLLNQATQSGESNACSCHSHDAPAAVAAPKAQAQPSSNGNGGVSSPDVDALVRSITEQVMSALSGTGK
ncbi:class II aldolase/adducin family protein [Paludisphaera borealis]|uniref:Methylthioribulose-1-phosphate dehydratase n=1 Tax=Paludisphaera borealis TaxID=1387353 RepID=A0A1U7CVQ6_9BACT|nr:class II aldolase/adducin family protein [Paludisphaera borealis]APW62978.1 Methylthioribulose-1-phosphate dehydratase [Paludisphaera borealis]